MSIKTKMLSTAVSFGLVAGMASAEEITIALAFGRGRGAHKQVVDR